MKGRDFVQQLLDGTVLNEKHRKIVAQVTSGLEYKNSHRRKFSGGCLLKKSNIMVQFRENVMCLQYYQKSLHNQNL